MRGLLLAVLFLGRWEELGAGDGAGMRAGLMATVSLVEKSEGALAGEGADFLVTSNLWFYVPAGAPATPQLRPGPFVAEWEGYVAVDLRSQYSFQAEVNGAVRLEVNGKLALETNGTRIATGLSAPVRLNKGTNSLRARFESPGGGEGGDAYLRIAWARRGAKWSSPIPSERLSHIPESEPRRDGWEKSQAARAGRGLVLEHRCVRCHAISDGDGRNFELGMDSPSFHGIGSRLRESWMRRWILDPKALRASARMPRLLRGPAADEGASAIAAFLSTLKGAERGLARDEIAEAGSRARGERLFKELNCGVCHGGSAPGAGSGGFVDLRLTRDKFAPGQTEAYLRRPEAHFQWTRMPNFGLSPREAADLAAYLEGDSNAETAGAGEQEDGARAALVEKGRRLAQTVGCLNCHSLELPNLFAAPRWDELRSNGWLRGCVAGVGASGAEGAVDFGFSEKERGWLRAFGEAEGGASSLRRYRDAEFAERQIDLLQCAGCHGPGNGLPALAGLGGKLKPEWSERFLKGEIETKPRPWLGARMPAFPSRARGLARGLAELHGLPPNSEAEEPLDEERSQAGLRLVAAEGGFACVACHRIGKHGADQPMDNPGIDLTLSHSRLRRGYFERWLRNPLAMDPATKMPVYFDEEGRSPLGDVEGGDAEKQIDAIWRYLRLGDKMPAPF